MKALPLPVIVSLLLLTLAFVIVGPPERSRRVPHPGWIGIAAYFLAILLSTAELNGLIQ